MKNFISAILVMGTLVQPVFAADGAFPEAMERAIDAKAAEFQATESLEDLTALVGTDNDDVAYCQGRLEYALDKFSYAQKMQTETESRVERANELKSAHPLMLPVFDAMISVLRADQALKAGLQERVDARKAARKKYSNKNSKVQEQLLQRELGLAAYKLGDLVEARFPDLNERLDSISQYARYGLIIGDDDVPFFVIRLENNFRYNEIASVMVSGEILGTREAGRDLHEAFLNRDLTRFPGIVTSGLSEDVAILAGYTAEQYALQSEDLSGCIYYLGAARARDRLQQQSTQPQLP